MGKSLEDIFRRLFDHFGPQKWWPAESQFEVIVGAILTQNTSWKKVERAIYLLKQEDRLSMEEIHKIDEESLGILIKSCGFFRQKAKRLKDFVNHIFIEWGGSLEDFLNQPMEILRSNLLRIKGIGQETADSIILYAAHKPSFVVDRYTHRIMFRHGYTSQRYRYETLRSLFMSELPKDVYLFQEYHALFVRLGKEYCGKIPRCHGCPLQEDVI
ncbi:MAG: endonuclease III domain-containing protein [Syntrophobacterales bacterium]|nr:endonuclease III domain-containing protein [Syntrophobacterales bacterium]